MRTVLATLPLALALTACMAPYGDPYGQSGYPPAPGEPYPPQDYPQEPYPPQGYPPEPYPPQGYPPQPQGYPPQQYPPQQYPPSFPAPAPAPVPGDYRAFGHQNPLGSDHRQRTWSSPTAALGS